MPKKLSHNTKGLQNREYWFTRFDRPRSDRIGRCGKGERGHWDNKSERRTESSREQEQSPGRWGVFRLQQWRDSVTTGTSPGLAGLSEGICWFLIPYCHLWAVVPARTSHQNLDTKPEREGSNGIWYDDGKMVEMKCGGSREKAKPCSRQIARQPERSTQPRLGEILRTTPWPCLVRSAVLTTSVAGEPPSPLRVLCHLAGMLAFGNISSTQRKC
ncbi:hypothetical protein FA13DRAFT_1704149 [Coprinellus micaceus]|uniref:Uncharacterized protein n=1 Tax=Coprinellus micaceus TaxID=71717 RepID=A0A4Y7U0U1_COPMI|nr:hypothetical protein FA13DRAFT_1704149 [Coprinellus micaceus]